MQVETTPGMILIAENMTRARALEYTASAVTALNAAADYAEVLEPSPDHGDHATERIEIYATARQKLEHVFTELHEALLEASTRAAARPPAPRSAPPPFDPSTAGTAPASADDGATVDAAPIPAEIPEGANVVRIQKSERKHR